jgi:hypothetical protein
MAQTDYRRKKASPYLRAEPISAALENAGDAIIAAESVESSTYCHQNFVL